MKKRTMPGRLSFAQAIILLRQACSFTENDARSALWSGYEKGMFKADPKSGSWNIDPESLREFCEVLRSDSTVAQEILSAETPRLRKSRRGGRRGTGAGSTVLSIVKESPGVTIEQIHKKLQEQGIKRHPASMWRIMQSIAKKVEAVGSRPIRYYIKGTHQPELSFVKPEVTREKPVQSNSRNLLVEAARKVSVAKAREDALLSQLCEAHAAYLKELEFHDRLMLQVGEEP